MLMQTVTHKIRIWYTISEEAHGYRSWDSTADMLHAVQEFLEFIDVMEYHLTSMEVFKVKVIEEYEG